MSYFTWPVLGHTLENCLGPFDSKKTGHQMQRKTTGMMNMLENSMYGDRLEELGLASLERIRLRRF